MPKPKPLPHMAIPLLRGAPPPAFCPRCATATKWPDARGPVKPPGPAWEVAPEGTRQRFAEQGWRVLVQCTRCMFLLIEVEAMPDG